MFTLNIFTLNMNIILVHLRHGYFPKIFIYLFSSRYTTILYHRMIDKSESTVNDQSLC